MHTTVVTITNRSRWHLLCKTLESAFAAGVDHAVVVDNESQDHIAERMAETFQGRNQTIRLEPNQGAAGAYYAGIKTALENGAEYLLLLDDDNAVEEKAVRTLKSTYSRLRESYSTDTLCVAAFRLEQELLRDPNQEPQFPPAASFLGFHVHHIPRGLWKKRPWARSAPMQVSPIALVAGPRKIAPWGGLFFHRALIERFGYPDPRFVLYHDDTEFTHRVTSNGGLIWLEPEAKVEDIDVSWAGHRERLPYFATWIKRGSDEQVYYQTRNRAYLETHQRAHSWMREVNRTVLMPILWIIAVRSGKMNRLKLLIRAVRDGESGSLGKANI